MVRRAAETRLVVAAALSASVVAGIIARLGVGPHDRPALAVAVTAMATLIVVAVLACRRPSLPAGALVAVGALCGAIAVVSHRTFDDLSASVAAPTITWAVVVLLLADDVRRRPVPDAVRGRVADVAATIALGAEIIGAFAFLVERSSSTALTILQAGPMACLIYVFGVRVIGTDSVRQLMLTGAFAGVVASLVSATSGHVAGMIASVCVAWMAAGALWTSARMGSSLSLVVAGSAAMVTAVAAGDGYVVIVLVPACLLGLSMLSDVVATSRRAPVASRTSGGHSRTADTPERSRVAADHAVLTDVAERRRTAIDPDLAAEHWLDEMLAGADQNRDTELEVTGAQSDATDADHGDDIDDELDDTNSHVSAGGASDELDWIDEAIAGPGRIAGPVDSTTGETFEFDLWQRLADQIEPTSHVVTTTEFIDRHRTAKTLRNRREP